MPRPNGKRIKATKMFVARDSIGKDPCICVPQSGKVRLVLSCGTSAVVPVMLSDPSEYQEMRRELKLRVDWIAKHGRHTARCATITVGELGDCGYADLAFTPPRKATKR